MDKLQFRVLYREFLFRMVDIEVLSPQAEGDMNKLFGQLASLLIWMSIPLAMAGMSAGGNRHMTPEQRLLYSWSSEHFLIAFTMLIVGLFAVLSWESTFPNKRDVMALAPLPIRTETLFLSKITGVAAALAMTVALLHSIAWLTWIPSIAVTPPAVFEGLQFPVVSGLVNYWRTFAAYWITMLASGAFMFCCVLGVQGIMALILPRRAYLRVSSWLQMILFCGLLCGILAEPIAATPKSLAAAQGNGLAGWQFDFWFLGLLQQLKGTPALAVLAGRAWSGFALVAGATGVAYVLSYFQMLRKIIEEPDILPSARGARWLPRFGNAFETAIGQFSVRSLVRSRQHRMILSFYLGIGVTLLLAFLSTPVMARQSAAILHLVNPALALATIFLTLCSVVGMRIIFAMPLDLRANWIFRITPVPGGPDCLRARRRALLGIGLLPVWTASAALSFVLWPWQSAAEHSLLLGLMGAIVGEICLQGFQKIPFTCSYMPGKTNIHMAVISVVFVLMNALGYCAAEEVKAIQHPLTFAAMAAVLGGILYVLRRITKEQTATDDAGIQFVDEGTVIVRGLGLSG
jgi:hypothetical protein